MSTAEPIMLKTIDRRLRRTSRLMIIVTSVLLVAAVAVFDSLTGSELSFSIFYLLPETEESGAREVIAKIRAGLASTTDAGGWPIGASIGAVVFFEPPENPDEAISRADELMYRAKRTAKNSTMFFEVPTLAEVSSDQAATEEGPR